MLIPSFSKYRIFVIIKYKIWNPNIDNLVNVYHNESKH